jgi:hypothetical protein
LLGLQLIQTDSKLFQTYYFVNQVLLITDGEATYGVTDSDQIQTNIYHQNQKLTTSAAIFTFGIGEDSGNNWSSDLNYPLLRTIAIQNDGFDIRIKQTDTELTLQEYYQILQAPVLTQVNVEYQNVAGSEYKISHLTQTSFKALYAGTD